jgi:hypothetical protein
LSYLRRPLGSAPIGATTVRSLSSKSIGWAAQESASQRSGSIAITKSSGRRVTFVSKALASGLSIAASIDPAIHGWWLTRSGLSAVWLKTTLTGIHPCYG